MRTSVGSDQMYLARIEQPAKVTTSFQHECVRRFSRDRPDLVEVLADLSRPHGGDTFCLVETVIQLFEHTQRTRHTQPLKNDLSHNLVPRSQPM